MGEAQAALEREPDLLVVEKRGTLRAALNGPPRDLLRALGRDLFLAARRQQRSRHGPVLDQIDLAAAVHVHRHISAMNPRSKVMLVEDDVPRATARDHAPTPERHALQPEHVGIDVERGARDIRRRAAPGGQLEAPDLLRRAVMRAWNLAGLFQTQARCRARQGRYLPVGSPGLGSANT